MAGLNRTRLGDFANAQNAQAVSAGFSDKIKIRGKTMDTKTIGSQPKTDEEYKQEIDRMIPEIEAMLKNAGRLTAQARALGASNRRRLDALEEQLKCGNL